MPYFPNEIRKIENGQPVDARYTNIPIEDLEKQIQYLKWRLDNVTTTYKWILTNMPIADGVEVGDVVYFNSKLQKFDKAIVKYKYDEKLGYIIPDESCIVEGIVVEIPVGGQANIILGGYITDFDFSNTILDSTIESGIYYLSQSIPGKLTRDITDILSIPILKLHDQNTGTLLPTYRNLLEDHIHIRLELETKPAGDAYAPMLGERHYILNANSNLKGWLPADHPIFEGKAPEGAVFGYNIKADDILNKNFPIFPLSHIYIELNGYGVTGNYCKIDEGGIWWMTNCYGYVPWNPRANYQQGEIIGYYEPYHSSSSSSFTDEWYDDIIYDKDCPPIPVEYIPGHFPDIYQESRSLVLWCSKYVFKTDRQVVTELKSKSPLIQITGDSGNEASKGRLYINFGGSFDQETDVKGSEVVKDYDGQKLYKGLVVEGIKAGTGNIIIEGTDIGDGYKAGRLKISIGDQSLSYLKNTLDIISVNDVGIDIYQDIIYYSFPHFSNSANEASIIGKVFIPSFGGNKTLSLSLYVICFVSQKLENPLDLKYEYKVISWGSEAIPSEFTSLQNITIPAMDAYKIAYIKSQSINVGYGDILYLKVTRQGGDSFADTLNVISFVYELS